MAMTISCPSCKKTLRVGEENLGKKIRCPACQQIFTAPSPDEPAGGPDERVADDRRKPEPPPRRRDEDEDERPSRRRDEEDRPRGRRDEDEDRPSRRRDEDEDDRPSRRREEDEYSDRPSRRRASASDEDEDDRPSRRRRDDDDDDRPSRRRRDDDSDRPRRRRGGQEAPNAMPYIIGSVFVALCCCLPGGVVSAVMAIIANTKASSGDYEGAEKMLNIAKIIMWISLALGLIGNVLYFMLQMASQQQGGF
jgi:predicted Zn finger-like uncharacterized protein